MDNITSSARMDKRERLSEPPVIVLLMKILLIMVPAVVVYSLLAPIAVESILN